MDDIILYVGVDQSTNSSGVCIRVVENAVETYKHFYIIKSEKLTKKEREFNESLMTFDYLLYDKHDSGKGVSVYDAERAKTHNFVQIKLVVRDLLSEYEKRYPTAKVVICQEGISYGSKKTSAVMDLAGLNYLLRLNYYQTDYDWYIAPPSEIKKFGTGKGNANKDLIVAKFLEVCPEMEAGPKIDDIADAYFMSKYAEYLKTEDDKRWESYNKE